METAAITAIHNHAYKVSGVVNFDTVTMLLKQAYELFNQQIKEITFDFSEVTHSNSAGLAFLTALLREAKTKKKTIQFLHLPAKLIAAAKISDLDQLLCLPTT